jgi:hypothetical protein
MPMPADHLHERPDDPTATSPGAIMAIEITGPARGRGEAFIEAIRRRGSEVEVAVLMADGSDATARLAASDWDWLELRAGDIVPVRQLPAAVSA